MSLYADDDLLPLDSFSAQSHLTHLPVQSSAPTDPLQALAQALSLPAETPAQYEALQAAGQRFEEQPDKLPELVTQLLGMVVDGGESMLRTWAIEMVGLAVGRSGLRVDVKSIVAQSSLEALTRLLHTGNVSTIKAVIPIFSTIYPILFRLLATTRPPQPIYDAFASSKQRILSFVLDPNASPSNRGIKAAAWKFAQKVLLCGTRAPAADPRLQRGGSTAQDTSVAMISPASPLNASELEEEAKMLQTQLVTQMFSSTDPAVLHPIFNTFPLLCKSRTNLAALLVPSMSAWTPAALEAEGRPLMHTRSIEKTLRIVMAHLLKTSTMVSFHAQLNEALGRQRQRMEQAFPSEHEERRRNRRLRVEGGAAEPTAMQGTKHALEAESSADAVKRAKLENTAASHRAGSGSGRGVEVDISRFPLEAVIEGVLSSLNTISPEQLTQTMDNIRQALVDDTPEAIHLLAPSFGVIPGQVKEEDDILNPLDMEMDDEDLLLAEPLADEIEDEAITVTEFQLPPPSSLEASEKEELVTGAMERICLSGDEMAGLPDVDVKDGVKLAVQAKEAWMLFMVRLATRGVAGKRKALADYISADFSARSKLAAVWLNEEWYSDLINHTSNYPSHLDTVLAALISKVDAKDRFLSTFLNSLPEITPQVTSTLTTLCLEPERGIVGFIALRELIETRPPVRKGALGKLLELCTHPDRKIRYPAIKTVNRWALDSPMADAVTTYALGIMRRLESTTPKTDIEVDGTDSKDALSTLTLRDQNPATSPYITEITPDTVQQHVELAFALSRRRQDMLADIFALYPSLEPTIAESVEQLLTPLIQSLGATAKLTDVIRHFPDGAEKLALKVVSILSAEGGSGTVGALVKGLMADRPDLDVGFIIPIIGELDKAEIERQIPRIVSLLGTSDSSRDLVRTAFAAALQKLTPADLLVSLHDEESGRKATIEAIGICFSMTTVFRSDVLATSLSRITDLPTLPVVFLRTTIQAVSTYKSLIPFIANSILPKLVKKEVWTNPPLWDGFVRLAKMIAPASFGSLLQLPKEWLRDVLNKQPSLRAGLKTHLESKGVKGGLAELFGEEGM